MKGALQTVGLLAVLCAFGVAVVIGLPIALKWGRDVDREVTQHSRAYIESKVQLLNGLMTDHADPQATDGQRAAIVDAFCFQVTLLLPEERPDNVVRFQTAHC